MASSTIDSFPQLFTHAKKGNSGCGNLHLFAGTGIPATPSSTLSYVKRTKPSNLNTIPPREGITHGVKDRIHQQLDLLTSKLWHLFRYFVNQFALGHGATPLG